MHGDEVRPIGVPLGFAFAPGAGPAEARNRGEPVGAALNRGAQATGRAAQRAGSATGAAAGRGLGWAQRKVRGENRGRRQARRGAFARCSPLIR